MNEEVRVRKFDGQHYIQWCRSLQIFFFIKSSLELVRQVRASAPASDVSQFSVPEINQ